MYTPYTVKWGDTLTSIAYWHNIMLDDLLKLNPQVTDADFIRVGWTLKLPIKAPPPEPPAPPAPLPPAVYENCATQIAVEGQPECAQELVDVVHVIGEPHFYVLTEAQTKALNKQVDKVHRLMEELHRNLAEATPARNCKRITVPEAPCTCTVCVKQVWVDQATQAGLLASEPRLRPGGAPLTTDQDLQGRLAKLQQARDWYQRYTPGFAARYKGEESNWKGLQKNKLQALDAEINKLRAQLAAQKKPQAAGSSTTAQGAGADLKHGRGVSLAQQRGQQTRTGIRMVEIMLFGDPARRLFIPQWFRETQHWNPRVPTRVMAGRPFNRQLAADLIKDIKEAVGGGRKASPLGNLEFKLASWTSAEDNLLNALHQEVAWTSNQADAAPYAVSAEAHALRFAASASAGVSNWNPRAGNIDVGVKGSAAISMAEGSVSMTSFFPDQGGYVATMSYRNAQGDEVLHPVGLFRLNGKLELSCFLGARVQAAAGAQLQYKPSETPAGATALLGTPTMELGRSGNIGVKSDAFVGVQPGGALSGAIEWIEPDRQGSGSIVTGQANAGNSWSKLAEIKMEGNLAFGVGGGGEFGISVANNRLAVNFRASLVLGPGAGGGFATVVDLEQIGKVVSMFCKALAEMDYRRLLGVTEEAFNYLVFSLFQEASSPRDTVSNAFEVGVESVRNWWSKRKASKEEARNLAHYVLSRRTERVMMIKEQSLPFALIPPETLGTMVWVLSQGFIEDFDSDQEKALVILLSEIRSWRHFIEVLEHCSSTGRKVKAMGSLERIEALLNGDQQRSFNAFIESLVLDRATDTSERQAWYPGYSGSKREILLAARRSGRFGDLA